MNYYNSVLYTFIKTIIISFIIYSSAFKNNKPQCSNFVVNVYLYLALSLSLVGCFIHFYNYLLNDKNNIDKLEKNDKIYNENYIYIIISFITAIISIVLLSLRPLFSKKGFIYNHVLWLIFIASISVSLYPYFKSLEYSVILQRCLISTSLIFILMTLIVIYIPDFLKSTHNNFIIGSIIALFVIIFTELFLIMTSQYSDNLYRFISYIVIFLFSLFISYDTKEIYDYAKVCVNSPNYPFFSTNLFLDIINILVRFIGIK